MNWVEQVVPAMKGIGGDSGELYSSQEGEDNSGPPTGIGGEYIGTYDILMEKLGSY